MTRSDFAEFAEIWTHACDLYDKRPADGVIDLVFAALQRYALADIRRALTAHINDPQNGRFTPKPADIIRHLDGDGDSNALRAWTMVEKAVRQIGIYQTVVFDDPKTMAAIHDMGGWLQLCAVTDKDLPFKANEFTKRYAGYRNRPPQSWPTKLIGLTESMNAKEFPEFIPAPMLIGDKGKCLMVIEKGSEQNNLQVQKLEKNQLKRISELNLKALFGGKHEPDKSTEA